MSGAASPMEYVPMIEEVSIENFKGIKHCEIKDIGKINLFIGKNSCGKSSLMEAMYYTGKEFIGGNLAQCLQRRANRGQLSARELWYGYDLSPDVKIQLKFNEKDFAEIIVRFSPQRRVVEVDFNSGDQNNTINQGVQHRYRLSGFEYFEGRPLVDIISNHSKQITEYFANSVFIDPNIKSDVREIESRYLSVIKLTEDSSSDLAKRTAETYGTDPSWEFLPHQDFSPDAPSRFAILEGKRRLFFDNFGDGLHYGLAIISAAKTRNNTALFIEEIESHQHPLATKNLIENLLDISRINNLQLFITTHSPFVRNYLYYHYKSPEERKKKFRCFHILRDKISGEAEAKVEEGIVNIDTDLLGD